MAETTAPARTLASTVTITRSSHPEFTYFTTTEAFIDGVRMGQRARHDHTAAEVDAHLAEIVASAARLGVALTINDRRESF
jgi:thiamine monophosphate synthase